MHIAVRTDRRLGLTLIGLIALAAAGALIWTPKLHGDPDTYWHLATGEWILRHRAVPHVDPFSYTFLGQPWIAQEWLSELLMALAFRAGAWSGVMLLAAMAYAATLVVVGVYATRFLSASVSLALVVFAALGVEPMLLARPHVLAWPLLAVWTVGLLDAREAGRSPSPWLLPVMILWANLHGSFVLGLALIGPFALEALIANPHGWRRTTWLWTLFGLGSVVASLATPYGLQGLLHPFETMGLRSVSEIGEWKSTDFSAIDLFEIFLLEGLFFCLWLGVKIPALRLLLIVGLLHMALQHARHQPIFVLLSTLLIAPALSAALTGREASPPTRPLLPRLNAAGAMAILACLTLVIGLRFAMPAQRPEDPLTPIRALAAVPRELRGQAVYNDYVFGGYLIFAGVRPYIDGRADMYGDKFVLNYVSIKNLPLAGIESELDRRGAKWTILQASSRVPTILDGSPRWVRVWSDKYAVVHIRRAVPAAGS
jgi:hypothetical protein